MPLSSTDRIGHYEILSQLGAGGMGVVYLAEDTRLKRRVALKVLPEATAADPRRRQRLQREAEAVAALNHPNIVTLYAVEDFDGVRLLSMELVDGETLTELIPAGGLPAATLLAVAAGLVDALGAAHRRGIVHRDLKSSNVMIDAEGRVKVLDFGLAKLLRTDRGTETDTQAATLTATGGFSGTLPYMAPEQLNGEPADERSDIFSLGVVLYEAATGERPFRGRTPVLLMSAILGDDPPPVSEARRDLPPELDAVIARCLAKEPGLRYQSCDEIEAELTGLLPRTYPPPAPLPRPPGPPAEIIDFSTERSRHESFFGREDVMEQLRRWLEDPRAERGWVLVTGGPGMGKSALLHRYLARLEEGGRVPHHFLRRGHEDWARPEAVVRSLAAQVEAIHPRQADPGARPESRLRELLGRVSRQVLEPRGERLLLVIDGLDEVESEASDPLPGFLPHVLPKGVWVLCASRPAYPHLGWLQARDGLRVLDLDAPRWSESNLAVCRDFWRDQAPRFDPPLAADLVAEAIERGEGNVLHALKLRDRLQQQPAAARRAETIPVGLRGFIAEIWERLADLSDEDFAIVEGGLGVLCAARDAVPLSVLGRLLGWRGSRPADRLLRHTRSFLLEQPAHWQGEATFRLHHEAFRELLLDKLGPAQIKERHREIAGGLAAWPPAEDAAELERRYALRHAVFHGVEAGDAARTRALCTDLGYLGEKCRRLGASALAEDLRAAARRWPEDEVLAALERGVSAGAHWLRRDPAAVASLLCNQLLGCGWDESRVEATLGLGPGSPGLRLRHPIAKRGSELRTLHGHAGEVWTCGVTAGGRVVSGSTDGTLRVWDLSTGALEAVLEGQGGAVTACALTPDGRRLASGSSNGSVRVWDLESLTLERTLEWRPGGVRACAITADGGRLVAATDGGTLEVWDLASGALRATLGRHHGTVLACALTADGRRAVSGSDDGTLKVWDLDGAALLATLRDPSGWVSACAVTADGRAAVSGSPDGCLRLWDLDRGAEVATLEGHDAGVTACLISADGRRAVSTSLDGTLRLWDLETAALEKTFEGHWSGVRTSALAADGRHVVSGARDGALKIWDLESAAAEAAAEHHRGEVRVCASSADGRRLVTGSVDGTLKVWDPESGAVETTLESPEGEVIACALTPDGRRLVAGSEMLILWDLDRLAVERVLDYGGARFGGWRSWGAARVRSVIRPARPCVTTADGRRAVAALRGGFLKAWDLESGAVVAAFESRGGDVMSCAATADGRRVAAGLEDGTLAVWNLEDGTTEATFESQGGGFVAACAWTADGRRVVAGLEDGTLRLWHLSGGAPGTTFEGHAGRVTACAVTADGRRAVSTSEDGTLRVWDLARGAAEETLYGVSAFGCVAVAGTRVCAGDCSGNVWMLELSGREDAAG